MEQEYFIQLYLDIRRAKSNGKYPLKLRVFTPNPRRQKLYSTKFDFSEKEFAGIYGTLKPRIEHKEIKRELDSIVNLATDVANKITPFSFEQFEKKLYRGKGEGQNIYYQYEQIITKFNKNNQLGTASNYNLSCKSFKRFIFDTTGHESKRLLFSEVTPNWLDKYEQYMIHRCEKSRTTVSMYVRTLRTVFNNAIAENEIEPEIYPFGKRKYQVPSVKKVKKALSKAELGVLFNATPKSDEQQKAKDFWFFSYICNGMNIKDIAGLRYKDIIGEQIVFYRAKTINTSKQDLRPVTVSITGYAKSIIEKYGNVNTSPKQLIFPVFTDSQSEILKHKAIQNFTRFINQHIKKLAAANNIESEISTYWARHSFASNAIRSGLSMEFVSEALSHSNMKTTQGYFAGFEDANKKEIMESLMKF